MANQYGIPDEIEKRIRARDKDCVYCAKPMIKFTSKGNRKDMATIEHLDEKPPFYWKDGLREFGLAICCQSCNSSRLDKPLLIWFKSKYCKNKNINEKTVAESVKQFIKITK